MSKAQVDKYYKEVFTPAYDQKVTELSKKDPIPKQWDYPYTPRLFFEAFDRWTTRICNKILLDMGWMNTITVPHGIIYEVDLSQEEPLQLGLKVDEL